MTERQAAKEALAAWDAAVAAAAECPTDISPSLFPPYVRANDAAFSNLWQLMPEDGSSRGIVGVVSTGWGF